jgi:hypothetical protein
MVWHIATWYCEQAEQDKQQQQQATGCGDPAAGDRREKDRCVAIALSRYCTYLVVSAPELLPGQTAETKRAFDRAVNDTREGLADRGREWKTKLLDWEEVQADQRCLLIRRRKVVSLLENEHVGEIDIVLPNYIMCNK